MTHGLGWVVIFQFFVGWVGSTAAKVLKICWLSELLLRTFFNISLNSLFLNDTMTPFFICVMPVESMRKYASLTKSTSETLCIKMRHH